MFYVPPAAPVIGLRPDVARGEFVHFDGAIGQPAQGVVLRYVRRIGVLTVETRYGPTAEMGALVVGAARHVTGRYGTARLDRWVEELTAGTKLACEVDGRRVAGVGTELPDHTWVAVFTVDSRGLVCIGPEPEAEDYRSLLDGDDLDLDVTQPLERDDVRRRDPGLPGRVRNV